MVKFRGDIKNYMRDRVKQMINWVIEMLTKSEVGEGGREVRDRAVEGVGEEENGERGREVVHGLVEVGAKDEGVEGRRKGVYVKSKNMIIKIEISR